jgi:phage-related protein
MPEVRVVFYKEKDGRVPTSEWLDGLLPKVQDKCAVRIKRLMDLGHELRRPEADYLRDGIYELRVRYRSINYRMLYFFHGTQAVVISHGVVKEREVPPKEIDRAIERKKRFQSDPEAHTFRREL